MPVFTSAAIFRSPFINDHLFLLVFFLGYGGLPENK
jgi:hypothetical protein